MSNNEGRYEEAEDERGVRFIYRGEGRRNVDGVALFEKCV